MAYSNSSLVNYTKISPNRYHPRNHIIDTITIHCMGGNLSIETCGDLFANPMRSASSNYGIGTDGRIALYTNEEDGSWCSSDKSNDMRAVTIEVANDGRENTGWHVSDKAMESLIKLVADICKRNNIQKLVWSTDKNIRIKHLNGANMTVHRDYAAKSCPGDYLYSKHGYIADEVNKLLSKPVETKKEVGEFDKMTDLQKDLFVRNVLYIGLLDREADENGVQHWIDVINNTNNISDVCDRFMESEEYRRRTVKVAYNRLLNRDPDQDGWDHWTEWLAGEKSADDLYKVLMGSPEYEMIHAK